MATIRSVVGFSPPTSHPVSRSVGCVFPEQEHFLVRGSDHLLRDANKAVSRQG